MNYKFSVSHTRPEFSSRAITAINANGALIAYIVFMLCLTAAVIF